MGIGKLVKDLNKKEGKNVIAHAKDILITPRFSTGSLSLDLELGGSAETGYGIPHGKIISLTGEESTGKSVLAMKMLAEYQRKYPDQDLLWIDAEGAWDPVWAKALGIDVDAENLYVMRPEYMEQAYNTALLAADENAGLVVIDSLAALSPKDEAEEDIEKWFVGVAARLNRKLMRKFQGAMNDKSFDVPTTLIYINHLNEKIGTQLKPGMPPPLVEPGGRALRFFPSIKILIRVGDTYPKPKSNDESIEPKARQIKFYIEKNKTAPAFRRGHFWFYFDTLDSYRPKGCYDKLEELIRYSTKYNVVVQRGGGMYDIPDPDTGEVRSFKGSGTLAEYIRGNADAYSWLEREVAQRSSEELLIAERSSAIKAVREKEKEEDEKEGITPKELPTDEGILDFEFDDETERVEVG